MPSHFLIRPDVALQAEDRILAVLREDEPVGEFELSAGEIGIARDIMELAQTITGEEELLRAVCDRGHSPSEVPAIMAMLVENGLAVRYASPLARHRVARLATWTSHVDRAAERLANACVWLTCDFPLRDALADGLKAWGMPIQDRPPGDIRVADERGQRAPALIVASMRDGKRWGEWVRWCRNQPVALLPLRAREDRLLVGPLYIPSATPCPCCAAPLYGVGASMSPANAGQAPADMPEMLSGLIVDYLSRRPGVEMLAQFHEFTIEGEWLRSTPAYGNPRCPECSRLIRHPENAVIHG